MFSKEYIEGYVDYLNSSFETWFDQEVSDYIDEPLTLTQLKILCRAAWSNGAYKANEYEPKEKDL